MQFSTKIDGFEQNDSQGFEKSYNSYEQYPLDNFFIFTIYQNYTLALIQISWNTLPVDLPLNNFLTGLVSCLLRTAICVPLPHDKTYNFTATSLMNLYQGWTNALVRFIPSITISKI